MAIYRGAGGASEATDAATISQVQTYAAQAATSATAAATSASSAASNATSAGSSASAAAASASSASSYVSSAASYASDAAGYADDASAESDDAAVSAVAALSYANAASGHATDANGYMNNAETYMDRAEAAAVAAAASYDSFDDRYLGAKSSNPSVDNDGDALVAGAIYFNTAAPEMRVYTGSTWVNFEPSGGSVTSVNDRTGAVTIIDTDVTDALGFTPADAADLADVATSGAYSDLSGAPTAVSAFTNDAGYLTTETDPVYVASSWYGTTNNATNWNTAYGWGNHASAGYLTTETDPVYVASTWYSTTNNSTNWDTAYGWGNHASAGYLTSTSTIDGGTF